MAHDPGRATRDEVWRRYGLADFVGEGVPDGLPQQTVDSAFVHGHTHAAPPALHHHPGQIISVSGRYEVNTTPAFPYGFMQHAPPTVSARLSGHVAGQGVPQYEAAWQTVAPALLQVPVPVPPVAPPMGQILTIPCPIPGCDIQVPTKWSGFSTHMRTHQFMHYSDSREQVCVCAGCECRQRDVRKAQTCPPGPHAAHTTDIVLHIWDHHTGIVWPCSGCGNKYSTERSLKRHQKRDDCIAPMGPQICGLCRFPWSAGHTCLPNRGV